MTYANGNAAFLEEGRGTSSASLVAPRDSTLERSAFINQPIDTVLDYLENAYHGTWLPHAGDPTFRCTSRTLGRSVQTDYTLYGVPGGTQITAIIPRIPLRAVDPVGTLTARAALQEIDACLSRAKACLE